MDHENDQLILLLNAKFQMGLFGLVMFCDMNGCVGVGILGWYRRFKNLLINFILWKH